MANDFMGPEPVFGQGPEGERLPPDMSMLAKARHDALQNLKRGMRENLAGGIPDEDIFRIFPVTDARLNTISPAYRRYYKVASEKLSTEVDTLREADRRFREAGGTKENEWVPEPTPRRVPPDPKLLEEPLENQSSLMDYDRVLRKQRELERRKSTTLLSQLKTAVLNNSALGDRGFLSKAALFSSEDVRNINTQLDHFVKTGNSGGFAQLVLGLEDSGLYERSPETIKMVNSISESITTSNELTKELDKAPPQEEIAKQDIATIRAQLAELTEKTKGQVIKSPEDKKLRENLEKREKNALDLLSNPETQRDKLNRQLKKESEGVNFDDEDGATKDRTSAGEEALADALRRITEQNDVIGGLSSTLGARFGEAGVERVGKVVEAMSDMFGIDAANSKADAMVNAIQRSIDEAQNQEFLPKLLEAFALVFGGSDVRSAMQIMQAQKDSVLQMQLNQLDILNKAEKDVSRRREELFNTALNWYFKEEGLALEEARMAQTGGTTIAKITERVNRNVGRLRITNEDALLATDETREDWQKYVDSGFSPNLLPPKARNAYFSIYGDVQEFLARQMGRAPSAEETQAAVMQRLEPGIMEILSQLGIAPVE